MFVKIIRKIASHFRVLVAGTVAETLPKPIEQNGEEKMDVDGGMEVVTKPATRELDEELREGGQAVDKELKEKQKALIDALPLDRYELPSNPHWTEAEAQIQRALKTGRKSDVTVSVRSSGEKRKKGDGSTAEKVYAEEIGDKAAKKLRRGMREKGGR
ncbi:MAG: hypothetical protein Q9192_008496 [Flavoplaca navasiana]